MKILIFLINSGWNENRNLSNELENSIMYKKFPENVKIFYQEFIGLKIAVNGLDSLMIDDLNSLNSELHEDYFGKYKFETSDELKLELDFDETYYYSTLIGVQLFSIGSFSDKSQFLIDTKNNFYVMTNLRDLVWIGVDAIKALNNFYFGGMKYILDEEKLIWKSSINEKNNFMPPVNVCLKENPW